MICPKCNQESNISVEVVKLIKEVSSEGIPILRHIKTLTCLDCFVPRQKEKIDEQEG